MCIYGPCNFGGKFASASNARFDIRIKSCDPESGVRDFGAVNRIAVSQYLELLHGIAMLSNNRTLVWMAEG